MTILRLDLAALVDAVEGDRIDVAIARRGVITCYKNETDLESKVLLLNP